MHSAPMLSRGVRGEGFEVEGGAEGGRTGRGMGGGEGKASDTFASISVRYVRLSPVPVS
jgi:hypothetical protein